MKKEQQELLINFDFEEVNSAVFRNAQIFKYKKMGGKQKINVVTPGQFSALYFCVDKIFIFKNQAISDYSKVLDFQQSRLKNKYYSTLSRIYKKISKNSFLRKTFYNFLLKTPRQDEFFIRSGLQKKLINKIKTINSGNNLRYKRVNDFWDLSIMAPVEGDLGEWFKINFIYLYSMIEDKVLYRIRKPRKNSGSKKIVLRTRSFKFKATAHNTKADLLRPLIQGLLEKGVSITNIGVPHMPLGIEHENYKEISHNMSISEEQEFCSNFDCVILTAEAGLFTAYAATDLQLIQYDNEWSDGYYGIRLFDARKKIGLKDLDIRPFMEPNKYDEAVNSVLSFLDSNPVDLSNLITYKKPEIYDLGVV